MSAGFGPEHSLLAIEMAGPLSRIAECGDWLFSKTQTGFTNRAMESLKDPNPPTSSTTPTSSLHYHHIPESSQSSDKSS